jgi:hypothetical protein
MIEPDDRSFQNSQLRLGRILSRDLTEESRLGGAEGTFQADPCLL